MCGIAAVLNGSMSELVTMGEKINHRGVHNSIFEIDNLKVYFSWLPITDPKAKAQPFKSGKHYVWLNGFISNYKELGAKYSIPMDSDCDTELLARFIDKFNLTKLDELNGSFAVLVWHYGELTIFTDRYGIKQLYRYQSGNKVLIASEIMAIKAVVNLSKNDVGINDWKHSLGVMYDGTIYSGIKRVKKLPFTIPEKIEIEYNQAKERLKELWDQSIRRNKSDSISDCVFLSGGIDSGMIAKYIDADYSFSVDYTDENYSEIENIKLLSSGLHYSIICNQELFDKYADISASCIDDPKVGSCYTNYALTELAAKFATIIYSGAGGDEFFGGYPHRLFRAINEVIQRTDEEGQNYDINHFEYDLRFLSGVLIVEDRMAGNFAMETRYPLLDNDLVDFALSLPDEYLVGKRILKDISGLPDKVLNSPKKGFSNPHCTNKEWIEIVLKQLDNE